MPISLRMGFFASPQKQGDYIKQLIQFTGDCSILDPTAGEGDILNQLVEDEKRHHISTYGVELDNARAEKASEKLDHLVHAPLESMVVSNDAFSLLYLNPPYISRCVVMMVIVLIEKNINFWFKQISI
nr:DUF6094 domain-containing protein [Alkalibacillus aidingensis]